MFASRLISPSLVEEYEDPFIAQDGPSDNWLGETKAEISSLWSLKGYQECKNLRMNARADNYQDEMK